MATENRLPANPESDQPSTATAPPVADPAAPKPKPPRTEAQKQASRENGSKSRGPITPEGKHESSKNAILHGLSATEHTLLMEEDPTQYKEVIAAFIDDLRPATKAELRLVEKIGNLDWRLERLVMMETCLHNMAVGLSADDMIERFKHMDGIGFVVVAWKECHSTSQCLDLLRRYLGTLQHQFNTTLANFEKFEARRLARQRDRDRDPAFQPPYQCPSFDFFDPDAKFEFEEDPDPELKPELEPEPKPQPAVNQDEPEKIRRFPTRMDLEGRRRPQQPSSNQDEPENSDRRRRPPAA